MPITQQGAINTTSIIVPDVYVQIVAPQTSLLNGVPTNVLGMVGTAQWGPVNSPTIIGGMADYARQFGAIQNRKYDMGTQVAVAVLQGAANFRCVRVTDGTDAAATVVVQTNCITFTAKYSGTLGNSLSITLAAGSKASTTKVTVQLPGQYPEVFDNIAGSGNALWVAIANAINLGTLGSGGLQGPSQLIVATAGAGTASPTLTTLTPSGGSDGVASITSSVLIGLDTVPRKGMYALRGTGASIAVLCDADDSTQWTTQVSYGLAEGTYMIGVGPAGDSISNAISTKSGAGIDSYAFKLLHGDWVLWQDNVNGVQRLVSPQGFIAGLLANLSPQHSSLNKQLYGIIGTQKSIANQNYSGAELQSLGQAGIDVITNPIPAGTMFGARFGHNSSSNPVTNGDNYTRMTNYIAATLNAGMGSVIGKPQTAELRRQAKATIDNFLSNMEQQGMIGNADGVSAAFAVVLDNTNNPFSRVALGYMQADVRVTYLSIVEKFLINLEGGQSVKIDRQLTQPIAA